MFDYSLTRVSNVSKTLSIEKIDITNHQNSFVNKLEIHQSAIVSM